MEQYKIPRKKNPLQEMLVSHPLVMMKTAKERKIHQVRELRQIHQTALAIKNKIY